MQNPWISYVIAALVVSGAKAYASGCESNYQPETLQAHLPCVRIGSSGSVFDVVLQTVVVDPSTAGGVAFTNAVQAEFGR